MRRPDLLGCMALFAIASLIPTRGRLDRAALHRAIPAAPLLPPPAQDTGAATPKQDRSAFKADEPTIAFAMKTTWVLVQTKPTFAVLATADNAKRLNREAKVLSEMHDERRQVDASEWQVKRADHLFG